MDARGRSRALATAALVLVLMAPGATLEAHEPVPEHDCEAPVRPVEEQDDQRWQAFLDAVDAFRGCISDYAQRHRQAGAAHRAAANAATLDWNGFVRRELNVPQDFPGPTEGRQR